MMVLWQSLGINTYHQWFTIDHQCIAVIVNSKVIRLLAKLQWVFETEHLMSTLINKTQPKVLKQASSKNVSIWKKSWFSNLNLGRWYSSQPTQHNGNQITMHPTFHLPLSHYYHQAGREVLILTTQKSASLTKFFVYPPDLIGPPDQICIGPPTNPSNPKGWGGDRSVNWFKKPEQTWKTMK